MTDPTGGTKAAEHATVIRNLLIRVAELEDAKKPITRTIHYPNDCSRLLLELKTQYGIVGGKVMTSGNESCVAINEFKIRHKHVTFAIGNVVNTKMESMTAGHKQDGSASMKTLDDIEMFNKYYQVNYANLLNRDTISKYGPNFLKVARLLSCSPLGFNSIGKLKPKSDEDKDADADKGTPAVDQNKAYSTLLRDMKQFPVFDQGCEFVQCGMDFPTATRTPSEAASLDDYTLYVVRALNDCQYSVAQRLVMSKDTCLYYGKVLKEAVEALGELPFFVMARCVPVRLVNLDFSGDLKRLYDDETVPTAMKKNIANCLLGCVDKWHVSRRTCEWFDNKADADTMLSIMPTGKRIEIPLTSKVSKVSKASPDKASTSKATTSKASTSKASKAKATTSKGGESRGVEVFLNATEKESEEMWIRRHEAYAASLDSIYLNVFSSEEITYSEGFLPISLLKYQSQRLKVLQSWLRLEASETLEPIGVKTDAVFVRRRANAAVKTAMTVTKSKSKK